MTKAGGGVERGKTWKLELDLEADEVQFIGGGR
jgi:hypothetical protein